MEYDEKMSLCRDLVFKNKHISAVNDMFFEKILWYLKRNNRLLDMGTGNGYVLNEISKNRYIETRPAIQNEL